MRTPEEYASPTTCMLHGQAYVAETAVGRSLGEEDRVKIVCIRADQADQAIARLQMR